MPTMTRADLIAEVAQVSNLTRQETERIVNTIFDGIAGALSKDDKVELRGFGSFRVRRRRPRYGRNPKTGDGVSVPAKRVPFFRVGKAVRDLVNRAAELPQGLPPCECPEAVDGSVQRGV